MQKRTKESTKRLNSLILLIAFTAILLIISTYAWFTTQKNVQISNLSGLVNVAEGMEISLDAQNWFGTIDLSKAKLVSTQVEPPEGFEYETYEDGTDTYSYVNTNVMPDVKGLLPVSSIGEIDGKQISMTTGKYGGGNSLSSVKTFTSDVPDVDQPANGYFAFDLFIKNTNSDPYTGAFDQKIALTDASSLTAHAFVENEGLENEVSFDGSIYGVQNTMRVAMALSSGTVPATTSSQAVIINGTDATLDSVTIWEPNADSHVVNVIDNFCGDKSSVHISTDNNNEPSGAPTWFKFADGARFFTFGVPKQTGITSIPNTYNWVTADDNPVKQQNTVQTPADSSNMYITKLTLADEARKTNEFAIAKNAINKIRIYVWMEGQDADTINYASYGHGINLNLGFMRDAEEFALDADDGSNGLWNSSVASTNGKKLTDLSE